MSGKSQSQQSASDKRVALSILTVGYNSVGHLENCLSSLRSAVSQAGIEMIFINNGSDNSEDLVARNFPEVRILPSNGNIGFGRACNLLASHANGQLLLLLNPDTETHPSAIGALLDAAEMYPDYAMFGAMTLTKRDGSGCFPQMELPGMRSLARGVVGFAARPLSKTYDGNLIPAECVSGGCMMIRRKAWNELGGFDEDFFLYTEDTDLCKRAKDNDLKLGVIPNAKIFHDIGSGQYFLPNRILLKTRGDAHYFRKHFAPLLAFGCLGLLWLSAWVRFLVGGFLGLGVSKYRKMSYAFMPVALKPWRWWRGYQRRSN